MDRRDGLITEKAYKDARGAVMETGERPREKERQKPVIDKSLVDCLIKQEYNNNRSMMGAVNRNLRG